MSFDLITLKLKNLHHSLRQLGSEDHDYMKINRNISYRRLDGALHANPEGFPSSVPLMSEQPQSTVSELLLVMQIRYWLLKLPVDDPYFQLMMQWE